MWRAWHFTKRMKMSFLSIIYSVAEKDAVRARGLYREKFILSLFCKKRMWESPSFAAVPGNRTERPTLKRETIMKLHTVNSESPGYIFCKAFLVRWVRRPRCSFKYGLVQGVFQTGFFLSWKSIGCMAELGLSCLPLFSYTPPQRLRISKQWGLGEVEE